MARKLKKDRPSKQRLPRGAATGDLNRHAVLGVCGFLLLAVAAVFGPTIGYDFVNFDDKTYVCETPHLAQGLGVNGIAWAFSTTRCNNWHPLTWLSYLLDYQICGPAPWGYHLTNVLLHAAAAISLFLVLRSMTGDLWPSALAAAVFAVHPLRAESVAWIAERKDVLSGLFFMLTLAAYASYVRRPFSLMRYLCVIGLFALGLTAKPMLVTLPLVLFLLDYWPLDRMALGGPMVGEGRRWGGSCTATPGATVQLSPQPTGSIRWRLVVEKLPLLALSAASCLATYLAQAAAVKSLDFIPLSSRIGNALVAHVEYVRQLFYPAGLAPLYLHEGSQLPIGKIAGALAILVCISAGAAMRRRRDPYFLVGWCWYLGMLVPVIGLVQVGQQSMADRYTYLPQIGLLIGLAWGAKRLLESRPYGKWWLGAVSAAALVALMGCSCRQASYWSDSETLWTRELECVPLNPTAQFNLGNAFYDRELLSEAVEHYQQALAIDPRFSEAYDGLGNVLATQGKNEEAIVEYRKALEISPDSAVSHYNLGLASYNLGRWEEAAAEFLRSVRIDPDYAERHNSLANALTQQDKIDEAIEEYGRAVEIKPDFAQAHYSLGVLLYQKGRTADAITQYRQALRFDPDDLDAHVNLGIALVQQGRADEAITQFETAIAIEPTYTEGRRNLAMVFYQCGRAADAIAQWNEILRVQPENAVVLTQLARVLATCPEGSVRNGVKAVELARRAEKLTGGGAPIVLDVLAAAQAEAGQFTEAVDTAEKAVELATRQERKELVESIKAKIPLYRAGTPFREQKPAGADTARNWFLAPARSVNEKGARGD